MPARLVSSVQQLSSRIKPDTIIPQRGWCWAHILATMVVLFVIVLANSSSAVAKILPPPPRPPQPVTSNRSALGELLSVVGVVWIAGHTY